MLQWHADSSYIQIRLEPNQLKFLYFQVKSVPLRLTQLYIFIYMNCVTTLRLQLVRFVGNWNQSKMQNKYTVIKDKKILWKIRKIIAENMNNFEKLAMNEKCARNIENAAQNAKNCAVKHASRVRAGVNCGLCHSRKQQHTANCYPRERNKNVIMQSAMPNVRPRHYRATMVAIFRLSMSAAQSKPATK